MQYLHLFLFDESHNPYTSISLSSLFRNLFCSFSESNPSLLYTSCASVIFEPEFALIKANLFAAAYFSTASRIIICSFFWSNCFTQCIFFPCHDTFICFTDHLSLYRFRTISLSVITLFRYFKSSLSVKPILSQKPFPSSLSLNTTSATFAMPSFFNASTQAETSLVATPLFRSAGFTAV